MDINKIINNIKNSKAFQYTVLASVAGIIVYSGFSLFLGEKDNVSTNNINSNVIPSKENTELKNKSGISMNQKRILQEMKIDYKKAKNPNDVYLADSSSLLNKNIEVGNNIEVENRIYQTAKKTQESKNKKNKEKKDNSSEVPLLLKGNNKKKNTENQQNTEDIPIELNVLSKQTNQENVEDKIRLYADIYKYSNPVQNNGELIVKDAYWKELNKNRKTVDTDKIDTDNTTVKNQNIANIQTDKTIIKIVPGSSFFARLTIPLNSIYTGDVKPIAKIVSGNLRNYTLIGSAVQTQENNGLIIKFNRLVSPDGEEYSVNAIGVQTKNLSPKFVDNINRHIFPRITLTTLATVVDALFNKEANSQNYGGPAQSILSQELQQMASEYKTEIMVDPKYFIVIFY